MPKMREKIHPNSKDTSCPTFEEPFDCLWQSAFQVHVHMSLASVQPGIHQQKEVQFSQEQMCHATLREVWGRFRQLVSSWPPSLSQLLRLDWEPH